MSRNVRLGRVAAGALSVQGDIDTDLSTKRMRCAYCKQMVVPTMQPDKKWIYKCGCGHKFTSTEMK